MKNIKLLIKYDGTAFSGWQKQKQKRTVQGELEAAAAKIEGQPVKITGAGRTDAGVHALGQCANLFSASKTPPEAYMHRLNALLPPDIRVASSSEVEEGFSARYSARGREYVYLIALSGLYGPVMRNYCYAPDRKIDVTLMKKASERVLSSGKAWRISRERAEKPGKHPLILQSLKVKELKSLGMLLISVRANYFLHGMVRMIAGTMYEISAGIADMSHIDKIIEGPPDIKIFCAPPEGLYLSLVLY